MEPRPARRFSRHRSWQSNRPALKPSSGIEPERRVNGRDQIGARPAHPAAHAPGPLGQPTAEEERGRGNLKQGGRVAGDVDIAQVAFSRSCGDRGATRGSATMSGGGAVGWTCC